MPDVIIVGGGVIGTSIAYHLARGGCRHVVVVERDRIGSGSTERCAGGIRQQFTSEANVCLSMESVRFFERFEEMTGHAADFRQHGYLMLATDEAALAVLRRGLEVQRRLGLDVRLLSAQEAASLVPGLFVEDVVGATFCPTDGYADPYSVVSGFASAGRRLGVSIIEGVEVRGINLVSGQVWAVSTSSGVLRAPAVVNAAGPWAAGVARLAGLDIPVRPSRRHIFVTEPLFGRRGRFGGLGRRDVPMVVDFHNGFWCRPEGACIIFGMRNPDEPEGFAITVDWDFFAGRLAEAACHRLPALGDTGIMRGQAGLHSDTPDSTAIIGEVPGVAGLFLACGFSGHGFMHAPAVGRLMADLILGKASARAEAAPFRLERFQEEMASGEAAFV